MTSSPTFRFGFALGMLLAGIPWATAHAAFLAEGRRPETSHAAGQFRAQTLRVGTATAAPGTLSRGVIAVPAGVDPGYEIPVIVVNGARPGPTIALVAGLHGAEFAGIVALQTLSARLDPQQIAGRAIIVPLVNVASFERIVPRVNPVDGKNMNRFFPGTASGTQTERASFALTAQVLSQADYVIDYHGGDLDEDQHPYAYWIQTGVAAFDAIEHDMLLAFGIDHIIRFPAPGLKPETSKLLPTQAVALGKPTITVDAGRAGTYNAEDLRILLDGTLNVLAHLDMIDRPVRLLEHPTYLERTVYVNSEQTGTFFPLARRGERIVKGVRIGYVTDRFGQPVYDAIAPESGIVLYLNSTPSVVAGGQLFFIGVVAP